jgi:hypothetical protein
VTYELVLAVVPSDTLDLVERAYELMDPFCHTEECWERWHDEENYDAEGEYKLPRCEHLWDGANVGATTIRDACGATVTGSRCPTTPSTSRKTKSGE